MTPHCYPEIMFINLPPGSQYRKHVQKGFGIETLTTTIEGIRSGSKAISLQAVQIIQSQLTFFSKRQLVLSSFQARETIYPFKERMIIILLETRIAQMRPGVHRVYSEDEKDMLLWQ